MDMKKIIIATVVCFVLMFSLIFTATYSILTEIDKAGGVRAVVVNAGKEIKSISKEINEDN
jgi:hypothetical protein